MSFYIQKASGQKELFDIGKFSRSLMRAGADANFIEQIAQEIAQEHSLRTTYDIYKFALDRLYKANPPVAARYNIKQALFQLGPSGLPFEQFIGLLYKELGYQIQTEQIVAGLCVNHEIDVIAKKDNQTLMIECKFHNRQGLTCNVKIPLYISGRFQDIEKASPHSQKMFDQAVIVTNTRFTTDALQYAQCNSMQLLDWSYPTGASLPDLINQLNLHPITALVSLSRHQKRELIKNGLVLCRDMADQTDLLTQLHLTQSEIGRLLHESAGISNIAK